MECNGLHRSFRDASGAALSHCASTHSPFREDISQSQLRYVQFVGTAIELGQWPHHTRGAEGLLLLLWPAQRPVVGKGHVCNSSPPYRGHVNRPLSLSLNSCNIYAYTSDDTDALLPQGARDMVSSERVTPHHPSLIEHTSTAFYHEARNSQVTRGAAGRHLEQEYRYIYTYIDSCCRCLRRYINS